MEIELDTQEKADEQIEFVLSTQQTEKIIKYIDLTVDDKQTSPNPNNQLQTSQSLPNQKKTKYNLKPLGVKLLPQFYEINDIEFQFLVGELYLLFHFDDSKGFKNRISLLNNIKRLQYTIIHKKNRFLEIQLEQKAASLKYFQNMANKLIQYPNNHVHLLGQLLSRYQEVVFKIYEVLKPFQGGIQDSILFNEKILQMKQQFEINKQNFLDNFNQDEFITVAEQSVNFNTLELEINKIFLSEPMLILLGTTVEQYERYVHRFGLGEFMDANSSLKLNILLLKIILQQYQVCIKDLILNDIIDENNSIDITIYTFDHISIPAKLICKQIIPSHSEFQNVENIQQSQAFILMEIKFEIEPNILQQVIQLRQNQQCNKLDTYDYGYINDIDYSLEYTLQSELFLQNNQLQNIHSIYQQKASYRFLNDQEKDKIKSNQVEVIYL